MDITTRTENDITLIAFAGNLDTNTSPEAQQALDGIVEAGGTKIVVDFTTLDYISSAGLRVLLATAKRLNGVGGTMHMFGLNDTVEEVFEISGFSTIFKVFSDENAALAGL
jgi:anti-sigma B factor antagonist